jgi:hypothetical protein
MRTSTLLFVAAVAMSVTACRDDRADAASIPSAPGNLPPNALSAFITSSNPRPDVGEQVTVTVRALRGTSIGTIGSFTLKLSYDSTRLKFVETGTSTHGMVMANSTRAGMLIAAGASAQGFTDDQLVTATFRVVGPRAMQSLSLNVSELNSIAFQDQRSTMRVENSVYRDAGKK